MSNIDASNLAQPGKVRHAGTWGNLTSETQAITTPTGGALVADVLRFMVIPAYSELVDATLFTSANAAAATVDLGYRDTDGAGAVQDNDFFLAAQTLATAGRFRAATNTPPVVVTKDVYIAAVVAGATIAAGNVITVNVSYKYVGV